MERFQIYLVLFAVLGVAGIGSLYTFYHAGSVKLKKRLLSVLIVVCVSAGLLHVWYLLEIDTVFFGFVFFSWYLACLLFLKNIHLCETCGKILLTNKDAFLKRKRCPVCQAEIW